MIIGSSSVAGGVSVVSTFIESGAVVVVVVVVVVTRDFVSVLELHKGYFSLPSTRSPTKSRTRRIDSTQRGYVAIINY